MIRFSKDRLLHPVWCPPPTSLARRKHCRYLLGAGRSSVNHRFSKLSLSSAANSSPMSTHVKHIGLRTQLSPMIGGLAVPWQRCSSARCLYSALGSQHMGPLISHPPFTSSKDFSGWRRDSELRIDHGKPQTNEQPTTTWHAWFA